MKSNQATRNYPPIKAPYSHTLRFHLPRFSTQEPTVEKLSFHSLIFPPDHPPKIKFYNSAFLLLHHPTAKDEPSITYNHSQIPPPHTTANNSPESPRPATLCRYTAVLIETTLFLSLRATYGEPTFLTSST
jgi:hypothetical protein